jgi:hypothetical protein
MADIQYSASCAVHQIIGLPDRAYQNLTAAQFKEELCELIASNPDGSDPLAEKVDDAFCNKHNAYYDENRCKCRPSLVVNINEDHIPAFYIMTQSFHKRTSNRSKGWVERFGDWIEAQGIGEVFQSPRRENVGHDTNVTVLVWAVNRKQFIEWIKKNYEG